MNIAERINRLQHWSREQHYAEVDAAATAALDRIVKLEATISNALKHADANGMGEWPIFKKMRKALSQ